MKLITIDNLHCDSCGKTPVHIEGGESDYWMCSNCGMDRHKWMSNQELLKTFGPICGPALLQTTHPRFSHGV